MISREDVIFTIGYDGDSAIIDAKAKKEFGSLPAMELARKGLFRAAFSSALFSANESETREVMDYYNQKAGSSYATVDEFKKLFGVNLEQAKKAVLL